MEPYVKMGRTEKLYLKALRSPNNFLFRDLCLLVEKTGFKLRKSSSGTSHLFYRHPSIDEPINLQRFPKDNKLAKPYQVKQVLNIIDKYGLIESEI